MASSVSTTTNGVVVITHVHPAGSTLGVGQVGQVVSSVLGMFRKGHPKALGTVQIMFGAMSFLIGIVMAVDADSIGVISGIFAWGAVFYIIAGSLTIAADKNLNECLVKASLGMNIVATVTAGIGIVLYSFDAAGIFFRCYSFYSSDNYKCDYRYMSRYQGISGVMIVFSVLEFIVSICVSSFACKGVYHSTPQQVFITGNQGGIMAPQTPNHEALLQTMRYPKGPEEGIAAHPNNFPLQYSPATIP